MKTGQSQLAASGRWRRAAVLVHRYVGLTITVFLVTAGLTGTLLVFYHELDAALNPQLTRVAPPSPRRQPLDPFELEERFATALGKGAETDATVNFHLDPGETASAWVEREGERPREVFVDPYSGRILGSRDWGNIRDNFRANLMPFLYRLHYSLALDDVGSLLFGIAALLWTVDCFVGAYLTLPAARNGATGRSWLLRWLPAWQLRANKLFSFVFTWHRASGLWIWALLLVFAWSAVGLNLPQVYRPVMRAVAGLQEGAHERLPELKKPYPAARLSMREAHAVGKRLMAEQVQQRGFRVIQELRLQRYLEHGAFAYDVESTLDISHHLARTQVFFDANDGHLLAFDAPTGISAGNTITSWLYGLHFAAIGGLWYRIAVAIFGTAVAGLSVTGVWIWLRKRAKRGARPAALAQPTRRQTALKGHA